MKTFLPNPDKDQKQSAATTGATQGVMFFYRHYVIKPTIVEDAST
jgi:hypothetical protein